MPARRTRGRDRARLREGRRAPAARRAAQQRRTHARVDGDLQRVLRSRADRDLSRDRADRRRPAPAVDRLDTHAAGSGRTGTRLHEVGRSADFRGGHAGVDRARKRDRAYRAVRPGAGRNRSRRAGTLRRADRVRARSAAHRTAPAAGRRNRGRRARARATCGRAASGVLVRPRIAQSAGLERPRDLGRALERARRLRYARAGEFSQRSSTQYRHRIVTRALGCSESRAARSRRDPEPRLSRSHRRAQARGRCRFAHDRLGVARPLRAQRFEPRSSGRL